MPLADAINRSETAEAFLFLLTFIPQVAAGYAFEPRQRPHWPRHVAREAPGAFEIRVVNDLVPCVSRGVTFEPYPFACAMAPDTADRARELMIEIDVVDRALVDMVRALANPPRAILELVLSGAPDVVERRIDFLRVDVADYSTLTMSLSLRPAHMLGRQFPRSTYTPANHPGLFV